MWMDLNMEEGTDTFPQLLAIKNILNLNEIIVSCFKEMLGIIRNLVLIPWQITPNGANICLRTQAKSLAFHILIVFLARGSLVLFPFDQTGLLIHAFLEGLTVKEVIVACLELIDEFYHLLFEIEFLISFPLMRLFYWAIFIVIWLRR